MTQEGIRQNTSKEQEDLGAKEEKVDAKKMTSVPSTDKIISYQEMRNGGSHTLSSTELNAKGAGATIKKVEKNATEKAGMWQRWYMLWNGLPKATKLTLVLSIVQAFLMVAFGSFAVGLKSNDEEAHVATVIIIISIFVVYAVFDAIIYENTLQILSAIILSFLMMARIVWFICTRPSDATLLPIKITWGSLIVMEELALVVAATFACRGFGWRMYSKLGVDYRQKNASRILKLGVIANLFNALVKLDLLFLFTLAAVGVTVAIEQREKPDAVLMVVAAVVFISGLALVATALMTVIHESWAKRLKYVHLVVPLALSGPIALSVIYTIDDADIANAGTSIIIGSCVLVVTDIALWITLHAVVKHREALSARLGVVMLKSCISMEHSGFIGHDSQRHSFDLCLQGSKLSDLEKNTLQASQMNTKRSIGVSSIISESSEIKLDPSLAPLLKGCWLGKPSVRNPRKIRFFQLSLDGSTLRWGWKSFVRLYYVQKLIVDQAEKSLTLTFTLEDELKLKFNDLETLETWRTGLESQILALLAPDGLSSGSLPKLSSTDISGKDQISTDNIRWVENGSLLANSGTYLNQGKRGEKKNLNSGQLKFARLGSWLHMPGVAYPRKENAAAKPRLLSEKYKLNKLEGVNSDFEAKIISKIENTKPGERQQTWLHFLRNPEGRRNMSYGIQKKELEVNSDGQKLMISVGTQTEEEDIAVGFGKGTDENFMGVNGSFSMQKMPKTSSMSPQHIPYIARSGSNIDLLHDPNSNNEKKAESYEFDADIASHYTSMFSGAAADSFASLGNHSPARPDMHHKSHSSRRINKSVSWSPSISQVSNLSPFSTNTCSSPASSSVGETASSPSSQLSAVMLPVEVIEFEDLVFGRILGSGSEGAVQAAWYRETPVAVKSFNRMEDSAHEIHMYLAAGGHDNVVALRALCQHEGAMHLVLEYCPRGTLDAMIHHSAQVQWNPARLLPIIRSVARGLHHLHSRRIVHRDLKPANIFVCAGQTMKVGDLGMAVLIPETEEDGSAAIDSFQPGTIHYTAPELINKDLVSDSDTTIDMNVYQKVDVWSFGVTLWELLERRRPFEGLTEISIQSQWLHNPYQARLPPIKIPESTEISSLRVMRGLADLVEACTQLDPSARPTFRDILQRLQVMTKRVIHAHDHEFVDIV